MKTNGKAMKRKKESTSMYPSQDISRRKALTALAGVAGLSTLPDVGKLPGSADFGGPHTGPEISTDVPLYRIREAVSRQFTTFNRLTKSKAPEIKPGERKVLAQCDTPGIMTRLWFTISGWFWENWDTSRGKWPDPTILKCFIIRIYWDGMDYPSIECPIGDFFGIGHCEYKQHLSKYIGQSSGGFYCYFPMPFNKVKIEVENMHASLTVACFLNANYNAMDTLPDGAGRLHCLYNAGTNPGYEPLTIAKAEGCGHFVGCSLSMQSWLPNYLGYLEAPEYIYIDTDDESIPTIVGTGLEDYFSGGWYFREGEFAGPLHGVPLKDPLRSMVSMYRYHDQDAICFNKRFRFDFLNPRAPENTREFKFSSAAFYYQNKPYPLAFQLPEKDKLVDWFRIRDTDHQAIP